MNNDIGNMGRPVDHKLFSHGGGDGAGIFTDYKKMQGLTPGRGDSSFFFVPKYENCLTREIGRSINILT